MAMGASDKSDFIAAVSALLFATTPIAIGALLAGGATVNKAAETKEALAAGCVDGAEALWAALVQRGYVEQEQRT